MAFKVKVVEVNVDWVQNGKNKYGKAEVIYAYNGQNRTQKLMSFSNPAIFKQVQDLKAGDEIEVETTKNDKGYTEWAKISTAGAASADAPKQASPSRSSYETPEERALRQLMIVRQSSISNAVAMLTTQGKPVELAAVLDTADQLVAYIYKQPSLTDELDDIPA